MTFSLSRAVILRAFVALLAAFAGVSTALANEAVIRKTLEARYGGMHIDSVEKTPYLNLWEVRIGNSVVYTDSAANYIFSGEIIDTKTRQNLTQERIDKLTAVKFSDLPLDQAFKIVRGNGRRQLAYFTDPNCPYCKRLDKDLVQLNDATIHVFLYPILSPDSAVKAKSVWCSADRAKAWSDWMVGGIAPTADGSCATPVEKNVALGQKYHITGTPTLIFADGRRVPGVIPLAEVNRLLDEATPK